MDDLHIKAKYLDVNNEQQERINHIRKTFSDAYKTIDTTCKSNRETSLVYTKLEEAQFWAIKSITREEE